MRDFKNLTVWTKAHELTLEMYRITSRFPKEEVYGITSQMRRCSSSIPANIAEGCGRSGDGDFHRFLSMAAGSSVELEYFLLLSRDLGFLNNEAHEAANEKLMEIQKMLAVLSRTVSQSRRRPGM